MPTVADAAEVIGLNPQLLVHNSLWSCVLVCAIGCSSCDIIYHTNFWRAMMLRLSGDEWFLKYESSKVSARMLLSLPEQMLEDVHAVAKAHGISTAELVRRALTSHMAEMVKSNPSLVALRGSIRAHEQS